MERTIKASEFKQRCLALLDQVDATHQEIVVTKRGRPVARLVPIEARTPRSLVGSVTITDPDDDLLSTGEAWHAQHPQR